MVDVQRVGKAMEERPWRYFTPVPKTIPFLESTSPLGLLVGPNGGGKSRIGANLLACYATGHNHWNGENYPTPNICWAACLDRMNQQPIMERELARALPKGTRWVSKEEKFILPEPWKSEIFIKSMDGNNPSMKFESERILACWFDEEKSGEEGLKIWKATMRRTKPGWPLRLFMTVTPVQGYTWSYDYLYHEKSPLRFANVKVFKFRLQDCLIENGGFLTPREVQEAIDRCKHGNPPILDPFEYAQRIEGEYTYGGGSPAFPPGLIMQTMGRIISSPQRFRIRAGQFGNGIVAPTLEPDPLGPLVVLVPPERGKEYIQGVDPAMGVRRDNSAASVWSREVPVECAYWIGNEMGPAQFARDVVAPLGTYYNNALTAVEANSEAGGATISHLQGFYGHLYTRQDWNSRERTMSKQIGFRTLGHNRGMLFTTFRDYLELENFVPSEHVLQEALGMVVVKGDREEERIDHQDGKHDDHLFAAMIALSVSKMNPPPRYESWASYREDYRGSSGSLDNGWG